MRYIEPQCTVADEAQSRLRSVSSSSLIVRCTRLSTVGDRAFPVAAAPNPILVSGTNYLVTSRLHRPHRVFCIIFSTVPFPTFFSASEVTVPLSDTLIGSVTYLLTRILVLVHTTKRT